MHCLVQFAHTHLDFRLQELEALITLYGLNVQPGEYSKDTPYFIIDIQSEEQARQLVERAILIKSISELFVEAKSKEELDKKTVELNLKENRPELSNNTFKFIVDAYNRSLSWPEQLERMNSMSFLGFEGAIDLKNPATVFTLFEQYEDEKDKTLLPSKLYFGRLIANGNRSLVSKYDLKKRQYLGTTSMDAELSLVCANMALAKQGSLIIDPFVGTGSFLVCCSHFGALTVGADIDGRQIRGKDGQGIKANVEQYNLEHLVLGTVVCDIAHHPWRSNNLFDAIVCDPPYGVRAGAKTIQPSDEQVSIYKANGELRYPKTTPYEMTDVIRDLVLFAVRFLVKKGRLVFWLPTVNEEYQPTDIPVHPSMRLVANSEQNFGKWSRRLITMEKISDQESGEIAAPNITGHTHFRDKYFTGFEST
ncbi:S-adenosyl-L-methionine-dependent methyltransferase [Gorgonomyces haynaldii]|nr:S-adenosyl-L-methionine-dependent methyltransferase [Gorgonomyces haynaldii]